MLAPETVRRPDIAKSALLLAERLFFSAHQEEFRKEYAGRFLLIKGADLVGSYLTAREAYEVGMDLFKFDPFLIQQVSGQLPKP